MQLPFSHLNFQSVLMYLESVRHVAFPMPVYLVFAVRLHFAFHAFAVQTHFASVPCQGWCLVVALTMALCHFGRFDYCYFHSPNYLHFDYPNYHVFFGHYHYYSCYLYCYYWCYYCYYHFPYYFLHYYHQFHLYLIVYCIFVFGFDYYFYYHFPI